ncbi:MAG: hypothetical protein N3B15_01270 [Planctomycetota bacterium]|nr:hypothetical protein [Planctomycetota bacterium]
MSDSPASPADGLNEAQQKQLAQWERRLAAIQGDPGKRGALLMEINAALRKAAPGTAWHAALSELKNKVESQHVRAAPAAAPPASKGQRPLTKADTNNLGGAPASVIGAPFHNPYTFLPFPKAGEIRRQPPTPLSIDEEEPDRFTGIIELEVRTLSPLLSCAPTPVSDQNGHRRYRALTIGDDVIVPASGVRGALRSLLGIVAGTLGHIDEEVWLCQGRDRSLGPAGKATKDRVPARVFLAEVVRPGSSTREGTVRLGETRLVELSKLEAAASKANLNLERPQSGKPQPLLWATEDGSSLSHTRDARHAWRVKLSGRPIHKQGKREGLFKPGEREITLPPRLWGAYLGRNRHGERPELRPGDLVWLEPVRLDLQRIERPEDVKSIQWARWGREGQQLLQVIAEHHRHMLPDCVNPDGLVDEVTNLFGQVPRQDLAELIAPGWRKAGQPGPAAAFAARVRPENLVFRDARTRLLTGIALAPLAPPHPGCRAFYRDNPDPDLISERDPLRGYKVYRTTSERGERAPWLYQNQGVYGEQGQLLPAQQKVNKTVDLLPEGEVGRLRLAVRALTQRELALLLAACTVDWRLGGGKPFGLGHCRITACRVLDEQGQEVRRLSSSHGERLELPADLAALVQDLLPRFRLWQASQEPVPFLRYPRAVVDNNNRKQRGGHVWFQRHARPKMGLAGASPGLQVLWTRGALQQQAEGKDRIRAQVLPAFDPAQPQADVLYGYDLIPGDAVPGKDKRTFIGKLEPFAAKHVRGDERSGGSHGHNREARQRDREQRRNEEDPDAPSPKSKR